MTDNKTRTSLSLSSTALAAFSDDDNRSAVVNTLLESITLNKTTVNFIKAVTGRGDLDYKSLIELGLEQLKAKAEKQKDLQNFTKYVVKQIHPVKASREVAVRNIVGDVSTWDELASALPDYDLSNLKGVNDRDINGYSNRSYFYEDRLVRKSTDNSYSVTRNGQIKPA